jgi:hypothetical protein
MLYAGDEYYDDAVTSGMLPEERAEDADNCHDELDDCRAAEEEEYGTNRIPPHG